MNNIITDRNPPAVEASVPSDCHYKKICIIKSASAGRTTFVNNLAEHLAKNVEAKGE